MQTLHNKVSYCFSRQNETIWRIKWGKRDRETSSLGIDKYIYVPGVITFMRDTVSHNITKFIDWAFFLKGGR